MFKIRDWDDAYTNVAHIPGGEAWPARWLASAAAFRDQLAAKGKAELDIAYGPKARNRYDLFWPDAKPKGLAIYIHGGYWRAFDKGHWSHLAAGALGRGFAVAMPGYTLCPEIRITGILHEVAAAVAHAISKVDGPVHLTGHSAGGHLAAMLITEPSPLDGEALRRIANVVSISGLHDLRPLLRIALNGTLGLDSAEAEALSPALLKPAISAPVTCWVGGGERAEFLRQSRLLANIWTGLGAEIACVEEPDRHHFNIVDGLAEPGHPLLRTLMGGRGHRA